MSTALQPSGSWVRVDVVIGDADPIVRLSSPRPWADPADYYDGQKIGEVISFGDAVHALSDKSGSPVVSRFSFEVFDRAGYWRDLLKNSVYLSGQDLTFFLASAQAHETEADPRLGFRGQILTPAPLPGRRFRIDGESRIGTRYGPFNLDGPLPKRAYGTEDFPNLPREFGGTAVPFLWGELSDEGTLDAAGDAVASGMVIPTYCGYLAGQEPVYALAPTDFAVNIVGSGATTAKRVAVWTVTANGETLPTILEIADYPEPATLTHYAEWTWTDPNDPGVAIAFPVAIDNLDGTGWHRLDTLNNGGTYVDPETAYTDGNPESDDHWKMLRPGPVSVSTAVIGGTSEFFCLLGHPGTITTIYKSNLESTPAYIPVDVTEIGSGNYFDLGPDDTGYEATINGRTYFGFLARGPSADAHKNGTMPFRVNLCGWHDDDGLLIDQAAFVYQDVFVQLQGNDGAGYQGGARLTIPSFRSAPTVPILQSTTFAAVQAQGIAEMGTDLGPLACVYLDSFDTTWRSWEEGMNRTFFWDCGEEHQGQTILAAMEEFPDPDDGTMFREKIDILRVEDPGIPQVDQIENLVRYEFDLHPIDKTYRSGILTVTNQTAIDGYGERKSDSTRQLPYTRDAATAVWSVDRYLADRSIAPQYPVIVTRFRKALSVQLGTQFRAEHSDIGDTAVPIYCRERVASVTRGEVKLTGRLRIVPYLPALADEATLTGNLGDETSTDTPPAGAYQLR